MVQTAWLLSFNTPPDNWTSTSLPFSPLWFPTKRCILHSQFPIVRVLIQFEWKRHSHHHLRGWIGTRGRRLRRRQPSPIWTWIRWLSAPATSASRTSPTSPWPATISKRSHIPTPSGSASTGSGGRSNRRPPPRKRQEWGRPIYPWLRIRCNSSLPIRLSSISTPLPIQIVSITYYWTRMI